MLQDLSRQSGMEAKLAESGTLKTQKLHGKTESNQLSSVRLASQNLTPTSPAKPSSALRLAASLFGTRLITRTSGLVCTAVRNLWQTVTGKQRIVPVSVQTEAVSATKVYNLTLEEHNVYYANGILAYNCLTFSGNAAAVGGRAPSWKPGKALKRKIGGIV
jgi:hypothetical protein